LVRRAVKVKGKLGNCTQVTVYGSLSVITTLEFLEHHFAKVGHRLAPYDPTLFLHTHCRHLARESVCRHAASFKSASRRPPLGLPKPISRTKTGRRSPRDGLGFRDSF